MRRDTRCGALARAVVGTLVLLGLAAPGAQAVELDPDPCVSAARLTDAGLPQRAVALVDAARAARPPDPSLCAPEHTAALRAVQQAAADAALADAARDDETWAEAGGLADSALAVDVENTLAQEVRQAVRAHDEAAAAAAAREPWVRWLVERSVAEDTASALEDAVGVLAIAVGTWLVLLVLARLLTSVGRWRLPLRTWVTTVLAWAGGLVTAAASLALAVAVTDDGDPDVPAWWTGGAIGAAALGVVLVTVATATRLRIAVEAHDATGARDASVEGHVVSLLGELGAQPPQGLEVPRGSDVQELGGGALAELPVSAFGKAVQSAARLLLGTTPWRVAVDATPEGALAVAMSRNGRSVASAVVERDLLRFADESDEEAADLDRADLHRVVAAFVVATLARYHGGFGGLCGASDWRSLGLHFVATTDYRHATPRRRALLARALELDPDNWLAQVAFASTLHRRAKDARELASYHAWLTDSLAARPSALVGDDAAMLRLRMHLSRAATVVNWHFAADRAGPPHGPAAATVDADITALVEHLDRLSTRGRPLSIWHVQRRRTPLLTSAQSVARQLLLWARGVETLPADDPWAKALDRWSTPGSPRTAYSEGCRRAAPRVGVPDQAQRSAALASLTVAAAHPDLHAWMRDDPQLRAVITTPEFVRALGAPPRPELLTLEPYAPHAEALRRAGLTTAAGLAHLPAADLSHYLRITPAGAETLVDLAGLRLSMPTTPPLGDLGTEVLHELHARGTARRTSLARLGSRERAELATAVAHAVLTRCAPPVTDGAAEVTEASLAAACRAWLRALHQPVRDGQTRMRTVWFVT